MEREERSKSTDTTKAKPKRYFIKEKFEGDLLSLTSIIEEYLGNLIYRWAGVTMPPSYLVETSRGQYALASQEITNAQSGHKTLMNDVGIIPDRLLLQRSLTVARKISFDKVNGEFTFREGSRPIKLDGMLRLFIVAALLRDVDFLGISFTNFFLRRKDDTSYQVINIDAGWAFVGEPVGAGTRVAMQAEVQDMFVKLGKYKLPFKRSIREAFYHTHMNLYSFIPHDHSAVHEIVADLQRRSRESITAACTHKDLKSLYVKMGLPKEGGLELQEHLEFFFNRLDHLSVKLGIEKAAHLCGDTDGLPFKGPNRPIRNRYTEFSGIVSMRPEYDKAAHLISRGKPTIHYKIGPGFLQEKATPERLVHMFRFIKKGAQRQALLLKLLETRKSTEEKEFFLKSVTELVEHSESFPCKDDLLNILRENNLGLVSDQLSELSFK